MTGMDEAVSLYWRVREECGHTTPALDAVCAKYRRSPGTVRRWLRQAGRPAPEGRPRVPVDPRTSVGLLVQHQNGRSCAELSRAAGLTWDTTNRTLQRMRESVGLPEGRT